MRAIINYYVYFGTQNFNYSKKNILIKIEKSFGIIAI